MSGRSRSRNGASHGAPCPSANSMLTRARASHSAHTQNTNLGLLADAALALVLVVIILVRQEQQAHKVPHAAQAESAKAGARGTETRHDPPPCSLLLAPGQGDLVVTPSVGRWRSQRPRAPSTPVPSVPRCATGCSRLESGLAVQPARTAQGHRASGWAAFHIGLAQRARMRRARARASACACVPGCASS